jgi:hypothetical protein
MKSIFLALLIATGLIACTNYGKKVKTGGVEVYYKDGISEKEAKQTADLLYDALKAAGAKIDEKKSVQLTRGMKDTIIFRMVAKKEKMTDIEDDSFYALASLVSDNVFKGMPVNIDLTDNKFNTIHTIYFTAEKKENNESSKATAGNIEVYPKGGVSMTECEALASFMNNVTGEPGHIISFGFSKTDDGKYLVQMVSQPGKENDVTKEDMHDMAGKISSDVIANHPVIFELTDGNFNTLRSVEYTPGN